MYPYIETATLSLANGSANSANIPQSSETTSYGRPTVSKDHAQAYGTCMVHLNTTEPKQIIHLI